MIPSKTREINMPTQSAFEIFGKKCPTRKRTNFGFSCKHTRANRIVRVRDDGALHLIAINRETEV